MKYSFIWKTCLIGLGLTLSPPAIATQEFSKVALLIPGTFNSVLPGGQTKPYDKGPYFGSPIQRALDEAGYDVFIPKSLAWFGMFATNGRRAYQEFKEWYLAKYPKADRPVTIIGHSAGGLYGIKVANLAGKDNAQIPIRDIVFLSTPLNGSRMADVLWANPFSSDFWVKPKPTISALAGTGFDLPWIDVLGIYELTSHMVRFFIWRTPIPDGVRLFAIGGSQRCSAVGSDTLDSKYLAPAYCGLSVLFFGEDTDGAVQISSSYGTKARIKSFSGDEVPIVTLKHLEGTLDHTEMHIDPDYLATIRFHNIEHVQAEQRRIFTGLTQALR